MPAPIGTRRANGGRDATPMLAKLYAIAWTTLIEIVRQPIYSVLTWSAIGLLLLNPGLSSYSLESGSDVKIMIDVALATLLLFGLTCSAFSATGVITREIESFTVLTVVSKPVPRPLFLLGKFLGVALAVLAAYYLLSITFLMTLQHGVMETRADRYDQPVLMLSTLAALISLIAATFGNYVYGWNFLASLMGWMLPGGSLAYLLTLLLDKAWKLQPILIDLPSPMILSAILLNFLAVMILCAFAVALSTRLTPVLTLSLCATVFVLGLLTDYYLGSRLHENWLFPVLYHALPNFQYFWLGDAITQDMVVPLTQVLNVAAYAGLYIAAILAVAVAMFQTREVG